MSIYPVVEFRLPDWVDDVCDSDRAYSSAEQAELVIDLADRNVTEDTGGPFGAAVFELESGRLVAPGVNLVVPAAAAVAHAEIVAIGVAGAVSGSHDLSASGIDHVLVCSTEPCAMCFGAVPWSGVARLVCCARDADARAIGFDEGPKMKSWASALEARGIVVVVDVERERAARVLRRYVDGGGQIYNGRAQG